ncbi:hypothetical protein [Corynebacterium striatum]|uniref:hypothetical protein n=1 Tax=Corynebacterium striatum TaxID=43770 RepID=UPI000D773694|nr:hypothetical protein [Corynebacterium striatum]PXY04619.1 hypothetical protein CKF53_09325 [Corynebacterium striatum]
MTNLENLAYTKFTTDDSFTTHNVAHLAYHDGLASDYAPLQEETAYCLQHPTNSDLRLEFDIITDDEGVAEGWTYTAYEHDEDTWHNIGSDGYGLREGEDPRHLLDNIVAILTKWAK